MACGRLEMDGGKGGEVHRVEKMKGRRELGQCVDGIWMTR